MVSTIHIHGSGIAPEPASKAKRATHPTPLADAAARTRPKARPNPAIRAPRAG